MEDWSTCLASLDAAGLRKLFERHSSEMEFMEALNRELVGRRDEDSSMLHIEAQMGLRRLRGGRPIAILSDPPLSGSTIRPALSPSPARPAAPSAASPRRLRPQPAPVNAPDSPLWLEATAWLTGFLRARGLERPDGRPFCRYRATDAEYARAQDLLRRLARSGALDQQGLLRRAKAGALLLACCAEWRSRESTAPVLRWEDAAQGVFDAIPEDRKRELAGLGLSYWRRPLRETAAGRQFLLSLALEGGVPSRVLMEGSRSWLKDLLRAILRRGLAFAGAPEPEEMRRVAHEEAWRARPSYRVEEFIELCAELVERILHWRRKAETETRGRIPAAAYLDGRYPDWRADLPLHMPADAEHLARELMTGLVQDDMTVPPTAGVGARRYLVGGPGRWLPALMLLCEGEIPQGRLPEVLIHGGRARALPLGELSRHVSSEIAILEPPGDRTGRWRARGLLPPGGLIRGYPFKAPVMASFLSAQGSAARLWPGGEGRGSPLLVFREEEDAPPGERRLILRRAGSTSSAAPELYALCPAHWRVAPERPPEQGGAAPEFEELPLLGARLHRVVAAALFSDPEEGEVYRVEPAAEDRETVLDLGLSLHPEGFAPEEDLELMSAPVSPRLREGRGDGRPPGPDEVFWRRPGGRWEPLRGPLAALGLVEIAWRDPKSGVQLEKRRLGLIPPSWALQARMLDARRGEIRLDGLEGWSLSAEAAGAPLSLTSEDGRIFSFVLEGRPVHRLGLRLRPPQGEPIRGELSARARACVAVRADGALFAPGELLDLGLTRGGLLASPLRARVAMGLRGRRDGSVRIEFEGELPLAALRPDIERMLVAAPRQDDEVEVEFIGDARPILRIGRYRARQLLAEPDGRVRWSPGLRDPGARPVMRMLLAPHAEHELEPDSEAGFWRPPAICRGPCFIYLREGPDVISRPSPLLLEGAPESSAGERLTAALAVADFGLRRVALGVEMERFAEEPEMGREAIWLLDLLQSLKGTPPSAFDALSALARAPVALIRLLLSARDESERREIWELQNRLPFLWLQFGAADWRRAFALEMELLRGALSALPPEAAAPMFAGQARRLRALLVEAEPGLEAVLTEAGLPGPDPEAPLAPLRKLLNDFVIEENRRERAEPNALIEALRARSIRVPHELCEMPHEQFGGLFAPVFLALSARGVLDMSHEREMVTRRVMRENPGFLAAAYPHLLKFYGAGRP